MKKSAQSSKSKAVSEKSKSSLPKEKAEDEGRYYVDDLWHIILFVLSLITKLVH